MRFATIGILRGAAALVFVSALTLDAALPALAQPETVLYSFSGTKQNGPDGAEPVGGLVSDIKGNLYGTTYEGGTSGVGTVFEVTAKGVESVLYSFNRSGDGCEPEVPLIRDKQGNLYGAAYQCGHGGGAVFEISPSGTETILYAFCSQANCTDGSRPNGLVFDKAGNLYGTTRGRRRSLLQRLRQCNWLRSSFRVDSSAGRRRAVE